MRIKCYTNLYVGESIKKNKNQYIMDLMEGNLSHSVYIITLSSGVQNHLEFYAASLLRQFIYKDEEMFIIGIAGNYNEAVDLVEKITQDTLDRTNSTDIRGYILKEQKVFEEGRI